MALGKSWFTQPTEMVSVHFYTEFSIPLNKEKEIKATKQNSF